MSFFGRDALGYSAIQPPFDINFLWSLDNISKLAFKFFGETISLPVLCKVNIRHPGISNLHRHRHLKGTNSHLGRVEPWRFISYAQRNSS